LNGIQGLKEIEWDSRFRVQGSGFKVQGSRFRVQGSLLRLPGYAGQAGFWVQRSEGIYKSEYRITNVECRRKEFCLFIKNKE
jgi:hypothetical protein